ncbi:MAG: hypothetical protein P8Y23_06965 [Candidatus Lokiarchaeota archaeon]
MVKKLYICRECGHVYPEELSEYIENRVQVFCEMCGTPFSLEGVDFKQSTPMPPNKPEKSASYTRADKSKSTLSRIIRVLNKISYLPLLIFAGIILGSTFHVIFFPYNWLYVLIRSMVIGLSALLIVFYDINHISPKIKEEKYDEILLDSFCYGILGCIIYGTGVILLIKGVFIIIYVIVNTKEEKNKLYSFGLKLKNSINYFSARAGLIIFLFLVFSIFGNNVAAQFFQVGINFLLDRLAGLTQILQIIIIVAIVGALSLIPLIILSIDFRRSKKIAEKQIFSFGDTIGIFILGVIGSAMFSIGIFILLKGILLFFLFIGRPLEKETPEVVETQIKMEEKEIPGDNLPAIEPTKINIQQKEESPEVLIEEETPTDEISSVVQEEEKVEEPIEKHDEVREGGMQKIPQETIDSKKEEGGSEVELKLHESLLPVKDEKDKKLVREYFSKIFNVLSKDLRKQIKDLNIPKEERKELLKELAFLNKQEQDKYIKAIVQLYKELPTKLIERIRKLPNIKPQYYDKIIEQLKFMDDEEQLEFVHFLEKNA